MSHTGTTVSISTKPEWKQWHIWSKSKITHSHSMSSPDASPGTSIHEFSTSWNKTMRTCGDVGLCGEVGEEGLESGAPNWNTHRTVALEDDFAAGIVEEEDVEAWAGGIGSCFPATWLIMYSNVHIRSNLHIVHRQPCFCLHLSFLWPFHLLWHPSFLLTSLLICPFLFLCWCVLVHGLD